jgi:hypothetical protein
MASSPGCSASRSRPSFSTTRRSAVITPGQPGSIGDGSAVTGKAVGNAPGATVNDIPWLKLDVVNRRGSGTLADVTTVQRINTHGGTAQGTCDQAGAFRSVPYSSDYVFLSKRK